MPAHVLAPETQNRSRGRTSTPTGPAPRTRGRHRGGELPAGSPGGRRRKRSPQRRCGAEIPHRVKTTHATTGQDPQPRRTPALTTLAGMCQHTRERHLTDASAMHGEDPQPSQNGAKRVCSVRNAHETPADSHPLRDGKVTAFQEAREQATVSLASVPAIPMLHRLVQQTGEITHTDREGDVTPPLFANDRIVYAGNLNEFRKAHVELISHYNTTLR